MSDPILKSVLSSSLEDSDQIESSSVSVTEYSETIAVENFNEEGSFNAETLETLESCSISENLNLTDEEKSRLTVLLSDFEKTPEDANSNKIFSISGEDKVRWEDIDKKLKILAQRYGMDDVENSSQDGYSTGEGEKEWTNYLKCTELQQIEKQLEELHISSDNETSE